MNLVEFGIWHSSGSADQVDLLGGKGANLCEMSNLDLPIPPGVVIPTTLCVEYLAAAEMTDVLVVEELLMSLRHVLSSVIQGDELYSVRSGARVSMPGMMDTILNVGLLPSNIDSWMYKLGDKAALDSYRRGIEMYGTIAKKIPSSLFRDAKEEALGLEGLSPEEMNQLSYDGWWDLCDRFMCVYTKNVGAVYPDVVIDQIIDSVVAVWGSWNNERARIYRDLHGIPHDWGTAVIIQKMVFGNLNENSCSGVVFTRDPSTGANKWSGEFIVNAQGEDVVAGTSTPTSITDGRLQDWDWDIASDLQHYCNVLENHYGDMMDIEFTVEDGDLYILQCRSGKRTAQAAFKIAYDKYLDNSISKEDMFRRVTGRQYSMLKLDWIDPSYNVPATLQGIAGGGGVVKGVAVFDNNQALVSTESCILVRAETTPDDLPGMNAAVGVLTATGGLTSHAAVVARSLDKACVVGCSSIKVINNSMILEDGTIVFPGVTITMDGSTGKVWIEKAVPVKKGRISDEAKVIVRLAMEEHGLCASGKTMNDRVGNYLVVDSSDYPVDRFASVLENLAAEGDWNKVVVDFRDATPFDAEFESIFGTATFSSHVSQKFEIMVDLHVKGVFDKINILDGPNAAYLPEMIFAEKVQAAYLSPERAAFMFLGGEV